MIVLDDDTADDSAQTTTAPATETAPADTAAAEEASDDGTPATPGETRLKRIVIGSDKATPADIVNQAGCGLRRR